MRNKFFSSALLASFAPSFLSSAMGDFQRETVGNENSELTQQTSDKKGDALNKDDDLLDADLENYGSAIFITAVACTGILLFFATTALLIDLAHKNKKNLEDFNKILERKIADAQGSNTKITDALKRIEEDYVEKLNEKKVLIGKQILDNTFIPVRALEIKEVLEETRGCIAAFKSCYGSFHKADFSKLHTGLKDIFEKKFSYEIVKSMFVPDKDFRFSYENLDVKFGDVGSKYFLDEATYEKLKADLFNTDTGVNFFLYNFVFAKSSLGGMRLVSKFLLDDDVIKALIKVSDDRGNTVYRNFEKDIDFLISAYLKKGLTPNWEENSAKLNFYLDKGENGYEKQQEKLEKEREDIKDELKKDSNAHKKYLYENNSKYKELFKMKEKNDYIIKTCGDITKLVNEENKRGFILDISGKVVETLNSFNEKNQNNGLKVQGLSKDDLSKFNKNEVFWN